MQETTNIRPLPDPLHFPFERGSEKKSQLRIPAFIDKVHFRDVRLNVCNTHNILRFAPHKVFDIIDRNVQRPLNRLTRAEGTVGRNNNIRQDSQEFKKLIF